MVAGEATIRIGWSSSTAEIIRLRKHLSNVYGLLNSSSVVLPLPKEHVKIRSMREQDTKKERQRKTHSF